MGHPRFQDAYYEEVDTWLKLNPDMTMPALAKELKEKFPKVNLVMNTLYGLSKRFRQTGTCKFPPRKPVQKPLNRSATKSEGKIEKSAPKPVPELTTAQIEEAVLSMLVKGRKYDELERRYNEALEVQHKTIKRNFELERQLQDSFAYKLALANGNIRQPVSPIEKVKQG